MRKILLIVGVALNAQTRGGISAREFSISHSPCEHRHVPDVEKAIHVSVDSGPVSTMELHNISAKPITAFVYTARKGATGWYGASGEDLIYDMVWDKNSRWPPGGVLRRRLGKGREREVFPCAVVFEDGTALGPLQVASYIQQSRSNMAAGLTALIGYLESALKSDDPRSSVAQRIKQLKRRCDTPRKYAYLDAGVLSDISSSDKAAARKIISEHLVHPARGTRGACAHGHQRCL
jgi:hypothetical protein